MRGVYRASVQATGVTAAKTLLYVTAPATAAVEILSASITNVSNETSEQLEAALDRVSSLGTPTATTLTPSKTENGDQVAGSTVKGNITASEPTYASNSQQGKEGFPSVGGWRYQPVPEERMIIPPSGTVGLRLLTTSLTSCDFDVEIVFREIG